jgi:hypothetical protein
MDSRLRGNDTKEGIFRFDTLISSTIPKKEKGNEYACEHFAVLAMAGCSRSA